jgi:putative IMPACT (imprinted ancient) family translation regulator
MADPGDPIPDAFHTVDGPGEASLEVRGSTFIGHVRAVDDVEATDTHVDELAREHPDASHVVPAYRIRSGGGRASCSVNGRTMPANPLDRPGSRC